MCDANACFEQKLPFPFTQTHYAILLPYKVYVMYPQVHVALSFLDYYTLYTMHSTRI